MSRDANGTRLRSLHNEERLAGSGMNAEIAQDLHNLQELYNNIFSKLMSYLSTYTGGFFNTYLNSLPEVTVMSIVAEINNSNLFDTRILQNPALFVHDKSMPNKYVSLANDLMDVIKQTLAERTRISDLEGQIEHCKTYKEILESSSKLNEYIKEMQRTSYLFDAHATYNEPIELKLWYQVYLDTHGPPGDGVFDSELLGQIIQDLISEGRISADTVLN